MFDYEEYFFGDEDEGEEYDYKVMAELLLKKKRDRIFWHTISEYELMTYAYILCEYYDDLFLEEHWDNIIVEKISKRVGHDLNMCYKVFQVRFSDNSDVMAVMGLLMEVLKFSFMASGSFMGMSLNEIEEKGNYYIRISAADLNPFAITLVVGERRRMSKKQKENYKQKTMEAIAYVKSKYPASLIKDVILEYLPSRLEGRGLHI